ncbi:protein MNN4-like [Cucumis melo var. makuwa]|uniref:Protein MNN4-like n=2 Tax=Cucumis melo TaxID=3656 RepID=A0A5A7UZY5_CUCMM|nr:protein MNN4-like [Cucumis melo var. makuwa]
MEKPDERDHEGFSTSIVETEFERVAKKTKEKKEKVAYDLLKIKLKARGFKALAQEKKETKLKEQHKLLNKMNKVSFFVVKDKAMKTSNEEICEELEKELGK